jgi:hypothetical protein
MNAFKPGDEVEITLKMHGTSGRTAYLPVFQRYKRTLWDKLTKKIGKPVYDWGYVSGTRRVVLDSYDGGFYGSNSFREQHSKRFEGKLMKGETVYYEIVGFTDDGTPIMPACSNKKLNDKDFVKQYGEQTVFSYGCYAKGMKETGRPRIVGTVEATIINENGEKFVVTANDTKLYEPAPKSELYVYRMTMTNEDGFVVEYTPDFMRYRCEQMGVNTVPVFYRGFIPEYYQLPDNVGNLTEINAGEFIKGIAEQFYDGADPIGKTHVREGVVCRIINRPKFAAYKHKNFSFKVLEGLIKEVADAPDMEEQQEVVSDDG